MINSRLRSIRKELSLTQENLARVLGIGKSALSMIETGKASLSERNKNILVQELNVNPDWLETGEGPMFLEVRPCGRLCGTLRPDASLAERSAVQYRGYGRAGSAVSGQALARAGGLHSHSEPASLRRGDLRGRRQHVPAAQERRYRTL